MERDELADRLTHASQAALAFAKQCVLEELPPQLLFRVVFQWAPPTEATDANDGSFETARALQQVDAEGVIAALWRDGRIPEWVNIHADAVGDQFTRIDLLACQRFVLEDFPIPPDYGAWPPFQVRGPAMTRDHGGRRYSIFEVSTSWTLAQLERARHDAVWLELCGDAFDDHTLARCEPNLERLTLRRTRITPDAVDALQRLHPALQINTHPH